MKRPFALLGGAAVLIAAMLMAQVGAAPAAAEEQVFEPVVTDDGLLAQPWFLESFLELADDLEEARAGGKRLAVIWEQKGCPYCKTMHSVNFAQPEIQSFVRDNFLVLQLNLFGSREVTDFDGEVLPEKAMARKYGIAFTPTIQFFPDGLEAVAGKSGKAAEVARMPGYFEPPYFLAMFRFVRDKAYLETDFLSYANKALQQSARPAESPGDE